MRIEVTLSGALRVAAGSARVELSVEGESPTLADALDVLCLCYPRTQRYLRDASGVVPPSVRMLLNDARLDDDAPADETALRDGDRLALLMPVIGG